MVADTCTLRLARSDGNGEELELNVSPYNRVQYVKGLLLKGHTIATRTGIRACEIDLVHHSSGQILSDGKMLLEYGIDQSTNITYAVHAPYGISTDPLEVGMKDIVEQALFGMSKGFAPKLEESSTGGTYRLFGGDGGPVAVLKPADEEAYAPCNPRAYVGACDSPGLVAGVYSTQGTAREVAAYQFDHDHFASVPKTCQVHAKHPSLNNSCSGLPEWKSASLQDFVRSRGHAGDFAPRFFDAGSVHRCAMLDIRIINLDRNEGNLLVVGESPPSDTSPAALVPIDHGLCLPDMIGATSESIVWMGWPQVREPFTPGELAYLRRLDVADDLRLLKGLGIAGASARLAYSAARLLQVAAEKGWTLYDIGKVVYRAEFSTLSKLEEIVDKATAASAHALSPHDLVAPAPRLAGCPALLLGSPRESGTLLPSPRPAARFSTPSTRASSPDFDLLVEELLDPSDRACVAPSRTDRDHADWPAERTLLFNRQIEEALHKLCEQRSDSTP